MSDKSAIVLVTGAAKGLGHAVAGELARLGHHVIISARHVADARAAASELGEQVSALPVGLDVSSDNSVHSAAEALTQNPGRLDVLINNAAAYVDWTETGAGADLEAAHQVMETNLFGAWRLTQALLPLLRQSSAPRVVNISSGAGSHGDDAFGLRTRRGAAASYGISKAALNALTSTLAAEHANTNLLINSVCPGLTATWPGAENMGARPIAESVPGIIWAATLPNDGPSGGFFRDTTRLPW